MNRMNKTLATGLLAVVLGSSTVCLAHEGHDVPGSIQAQYGGTVKATKHLYIELVQQGGSLMIYPMNHDLKPIPLKEVQVEASAQLPRAKSKTPVSFKESESGDKASAHFIGTFDAKGAHRYTLSVHVRYNKTKETVTFQVEPKN